ncbi:AraC family transcriptional regulator [Tepidibacter aestuarii]|uniref:AraC family transcriptional regulator n=1 Tax=Tepidibacter aestuarii TaxID=2925782 RepID=UPI0020C01B87|nr:AraC family transcriptional regulator [Tepidibacter aestuarii]CAH2215282.1 Transcriptional regulator, AraC family [Tepidibacter aestuarii]
MINKFDRNIELIDGTETDYMRFLYYDFEKPYSGCYKSYENNRICTILNGQKKLRVDESDNFYYGKDEFIILPPNSKVEMEMKTPTKALVLEIEQDIIKNVVDKVNCDIKSNINPKYKNIFLGKKNKTINEIFGKIIKTNFSSEKNKYFLMDLYIQEMLYNILKIQGSEDILTKEHTHPISIATKYIRENYDKNIKIKDIASYLNMSESNFSIQFKNIIGVTPNLYLKEIKLKKSIDLLKEKNVTEVAYDLGYENISYFISQFKNKYGHTPKQYQKIKQKRTL